MIIRSEGRDIPARTLEEAAVIAAYYSKASQATKVPVDYTRVKHVRKPNGARPGMVIYERQKTIMVSPDEELVASLKLKEAD